MSCQFKQQYGASIGWRQSVKLQAQRHSYYLIYSLCHRFISTTAIRITCGYINIKGCQVRLQAYQYKSLLVKQQYGAIHGVIYQGAKLYLYTVVTAGGVVEVGQLQIKQLGSIIIVIQCKYQVVIVVKYKTQSISQLVDYRCINIISLLVKLQV